MRNELMRRNDRDVFDLFDSWFDFPTFDFDMPRGMMKTDVTEKDGRYYMNIELPGFKKEDIQISLKDGDLTVKAVHNHTKEEKDSEGRVICQERYSGNFERTWYVGENVKESDIHAGYDGGILKIDLPAADQNEVIDTTKYIEIE